MPLTSQLRRAAALLLLLGLAACATAPKRSAGPVIRGDVAAVRLDPAAARDMVSHYREAKGLAAVRLDPQLNALAQAQADAMAAQGVLSHDVAGAFSGRLQKAGIDTVSAGENIAAGYFSLDSTFESWQNSPGHNKNLLLPRATRFGIALAKAPATRYKTYWAMVVASDPPEEPPVAAFGEGPVRRRVVQTRTVGGSFVAAVSAPFSGLFGN